MTSEDDLVWSGWFARIARPMSAATVRTAGVAIAILFGSAGLATVPLVGGWVELEALNRGGLAVLMVEAFGNCAWVTLAVRRIPEERMASLVPPLVALVTVAAITNVTLVVVFTGPQFGVAAVFSAEVPVLAFVFARRPWAVGITTAAMVAYACALVALNEPPAPVAQFISVLAAAVATGVVVGAIANRLDDARRAERHAKAALADLNQHLEMRVNEQLDELERTGRLRRFLAPQVAEVVTSVGAEEMLAPHRREIAVLFCDLRGFTRFTNAVEPEHVVHVLGEYYEAVGSVLERHSATIGGFAGDGVMAYIGDPVTRADGAAETAAMAREIAAALDRRVGTWSVGEHHLGYGIGLAYGTATLGLVGFEGRYDYTPVGAVVNLASRLCADARSSEIVIDEAFRIAARLDGDLHRREDVELKGFGLVATYVLDH